MSRRRAMICGAVLAACLAAVTAVVLLLTHVPAYYLILLQDPAPAGLRHDRAKQFVQATLRLADQVRQQSDWSEEFTEDSINAWLADDLPRQFAGVLPPQVRNPRIKLERGEARLAFQARHGVWSGVIDARLRGWASGPREISVEVVSLRAGLVPIPAEEVLNLLAAALRERGWRVDWKGSAAGEVLVVQLDGDWGAAGGDAPRVSLETIDLAPGRIRVSGRGRQEIARGFAPDGK